MTGDISPPSSRLLQPAGLRFAVTLGIVFVFVTGILALAGAPPLDAYRHLLMGSLGSWIKLAQVLNVWIPLSLCACGLLYTFRIGLWNIGIEGQVIMGAVGATAVLRWSLAATYPLPAVAAACIAGIVLGGAWALLSGFLKTRAGVNEIFAGLGLNFVAQGLVLWLIFGPWKRAGIASMSGTEPFPPELWFPSMAGWRVSPYALVLTLSALAVTGRLLARTRVGLCLKAVGQNARAAFLYGLNPHRWMLVAVVFAGGLAGLAGTFQVLAVYHRLIPAISSNYGYLALLVVMLANFRLAWLAPIAFFFAALNVGSIQLPMMLQVDSSLSGVIQGALVLTTLVVEGVRRARTGAVHG